MAVECACAGCPHSLSPHSPAPARRCRAGAPSQGHGASVRRAFGYRPEPAPRCRLVTGCPSRSAAGRIGSRAHRGSRKLYRNSASSEAVSERGASKPRQPSGVGQDCAGFSHIVPPACAPAPPAYPSSAFDASGRLAPARRASPEPRWRGRTMKTTAEQQRLAECREGGAAWRRWGPYLSERQWGTVREDYSPAATPGTTSPTIMRARAPIAGTKTGWWVSATTSSFLLRAALWNGRDPILKERLFGLTNPKATTAKTSRSITFTSTALRPIPTCGTFTNTRKRLPLPQPAEGPTAAAAAKTSSTNCSIPGSSRRTVTSTSWWNTQRPTDDILIRVTAHNRGPEPATLHLLPTLWFRNTWPGRGARQSLPCVPRQAMAGPRSRRNTRAWAKACSASGETCRFCSPRTRRTRSGFRPGSARAYPKDGINDCVVHGRETRWNPSGPAPRRRCTRKVIVPAGAAQRAAAAAP